MIEFYWDNRKAKSNLKDHGVTFEEAQTVFYDDYAIQFFDDDHSTNEDRFIMLGMSSFARVLLVVHCYREDDQVIRIISARKPTPKERSFYKGPEL
jgi:uncharacterized protein